MKREQKAAVVEEIAARIADSEAIYAADYRGISVTQAASLRARLREADASFRIVKNTLTLLAADKAGAAQVKELVQGPTAFAFVRGDPALAAKALDTFARQENVLELRGGVLAGELLDGEALRALARLPGRDQLNAQMAGLVASPVIGLVRGLGALVSGLAIALGQVREQKAEQGGAEQGVAEQGVAEQGGSETAEQPTEAEAEEAPAEEAPAEEAPAEEAPAEEAPAEEAGDQQQPAGEASDQQAGESDSEPDEQDQKKEAE